MTPLRPKRRSHPERDLQKAVVKLLHAALLPRVLWTAIDHSNSGKVHGGVLQSMGVRRGVPDLMLLWSVEGSVRILFVELKSKTGRLTDEQLEWMASCNCMMGSAAFVVRSVDEMLTMLKAYDVPHRMVS